MTSFAASWKRSKHNDEKNLSEFLLNQEIPRLGGIACTLFDVKFDAFQLTLRSVERALREAAVGTRTDASQAQQVSHSMRGNCFSINNAPWQPYPGGNNKEDKRGERRGDTKVRVAERDRERRKRKRNEEGNTEVRLEKPVDGLRRI
jgi:hypothetical protein